MKLKYFFLLTMVVLMPLTIAQSFPIISIDPDTAASTTILQLNASQGNETVRVNNLVTGACGANDHVISVQSNGTVLCDPDAGASDNTWEVNLSDGVSDNLNPLSDSTYNFGTIALRWLSGFFITVNATNVDAVNGNFSILDISDKSVIADSSGLRAIAINITNSTGTLGLYQNGNGRVGINTDPDDLIDTFTITGEMDIIHTATSTDEHGLEIDYNAAGFGDNKAIFIDYITGEISAGEDEEVILINIDQTLSTGGDVVGLEVLTTEGEAMVTGLEVGVLINPIEQLSGIFSGMDSALNNGVDNLTSFLSGVTNETMFVADDDTVTIGNADKFEEIEFILQTFASGVGIKPEFYYSTGDGEWAIFTPADGTNGLRDTGVVAWLDSDIPSWAVGTGSEFLIRINRTQGGLATAPIEEKVQIASATEYFWNREAYVHINNLSTLTSVGIGTDLLTHNLTVVGNLNFTGGLNLSNYQSCTALETDASGNLVCGSDGGGSVNVFDQDLNTTNDVIFRNVSITGNLSISQNITTNLVSCTALETDANGLVTCGSDASGSSTNVFDQDLNSTDSPTFNILNASIGNFTGEVYINGQLVQIFTDLSNFTNDLGLVDSTIANSTYVDFPTIQNQNATWTSTFNTTYDAQTFVNFTDLSNFTDDIDATNRNLFDQILNRSEDVEFADLNISNINITGGINFSNADFLSCTALETDASGNLVCGSDGGAAGSWVFDTNIHNNTDGVNVGIGDGNPGTKLVVNGTITSTGLQINGTSQLDGAVTINEGGANLDVRIESEGNINMFRINAENNSIGVGRNPDQGAAFEIASGGISTFGNMSGRMFLQSVGGASGDGNRGAGILFGQANDGEGQNHGAGINSVQTDSDANQMGLMFTTHPSATGTENREEMMRITAAGEVGIGTTSPEAKLDIRGGNFDSINATGGNIYFESNEFNDKFEMSSGSDDVINFSTNAVAFMLYNNNIYYDSDTLFANASSNNVGIGTITPEAKLHLLDGEFIIEDSSTTAVLDIRGDIDSFSRIQFRDGGTGIWRIRSNNADRDLHIYDDVSNTDIVTFEISSGNVGIGTTAPLAPLHVISNASEIALRLSENVGGESWGLGVNSVGHFAITDDDGGIVVDIVDNTNQVRFNGYPTAGFTQMSTQNNFPLEFRVEVDATFVIDFDANGANHFIINNTVTDNLFTVNEDGDIVAAGNISMGGGGSICYNGTYTIIGGGC